MNKQDIQAIQQQLDSGELDPRQLNQDEQDSLRELIQRGILTAPAGGVTRMTADRDIGEAGIIQEAKDANQFGGISTPAGKVMTERASFEMVGDVIGSFMPYLNNKRAVVKDVIEGVSTTDSKGNVIQQAYTKPTGKNALRLDKFDKVNSRMADVLGNVVGKRAGLLGKAFVRTASFLERAAQRGAQLVKAETKAIQAGDASLSMLRPGARTGAQSLIGGSVGAATGSAMYDMSNYLEDLSANLTMDIGDLTEQGINSNPFPMRLLEHSAIAASNSLKYGLIGTSLGYAAGGIFGKGKKALLGLNSENAVMMAKKASEQGIPLSATALASEGFGGFLSRNFFKIFGVTPYIGGAGASNLKNTVAEVVFPKYLSTASALTPNTSTAAIVSESGLGADGISLMTKNYHLNREIIQVQFDSLLKKSQSFNNPPIVGLTNFKQAINGMNQEIKGFTNSEFKAFADQTLEAGSTKIVKDQLNNQLMIKSLDELTNKQSLSIYDAAMFRKFLFETMGDPKNIKNFEMQKQGRQLLEAFDKDMSAAEVVKKLDNTDPSVASFINSMNKATDEENAAEALKTAIKMAHELKISNESYHHLVNTGTLGFGKEQYTQVLANALNNPQRINSKDIFNSIFKNAINQQNPQALKELKSLLGIGSNAAGDPKHYDEYARTFMGKLGTRFVVDAFTSAFSQKSKKSAEAFDPMNIFMEDVAKADRIIPDIIKSKPEYGKLFKKNYDSTTNYVDADLFNKLDKFDPEDAKRIREALETSVENIKIDPKNIENFDLNAFKRNLGIDTTDGRATLIELFGKEHTDNISDLVDVMTRSVDIGITDPSSFLLRSVTLGSGLAGGGISALMGGGVLSIAGGGLLGAILPAVAGRYYGKWVSNPETVKKALDLYSKEERRALLEKDNIGPLKNFPFTGGKNPTLIDPREPLGKYIGPTKSRNLAIFLNYVTGTPNDNPNFSTENITYEDIQNFLGSEQEGVEVPNPSASPFQLPPKVMKQMYPEAFAFKQLPIEEKKIYLDTLKAALQGETQDEEFNKQVSQMPEEQPQQQPEQQAIVPEQQPTEVAQTPNQKIDLSSKYSFLFPQDAAGQAIAQQQEVKRG
mgnify:FL=1